MDREELFVKALEDIKILTGEQGGCISRSRLEEAFAGLKLDKGQLAMVEDYLKKHRIGIDQPVDPDEYLTRKEADYLAGYLEELKRLEGREGPEEAEAVALSAMKGDNQAQERLAELYLPKVAEIARLYVGQGIPLEDLIGEGNLALTTGITMLGCLERPEEVQGMLGKMIMNAMEEAIQENLKEASKDKEILDKVNYIAEQARLLAESLQRKVTAGELAAEVNIPKEDVLEAIRMSGNKIEHIEWQNE